VITEPNQKNWNAPLGISWPAVSFLTLTPIAAALLLTIYIWNYGVHWFDVTLLLSFFFLSNTAISGGYHRYYSHQAYECHWLLQLFYMVFGTTALQYSVIDWSRNHRIHHQYTDTHLDPHNIKQGFLHAHIGWVIHKTPLEHDFSNVKDLLKNKLCVWQKKYYWPIFFVTALVLPAFLGWLVADRPFGGLLWGALLRIVIQGHTTYSINSFAHTFGKRPFSIDNEARDSWVLALLSNGEGFHNFHHRFASDFRNGWKWYHYDPTKWMVTLGQFVGLTWNLKKASDLDMLKAQLLVDSQLVAQKLQQLKMDEAVRTSLEDRLMPARKQIEKLALQISALKQDLRQSAQQRRQEIEASYYLQRKKLNSTLKEWRTITRRMQRLKGEQLHAYVQALLAQPSGAIA